MKRNKIRYKSKPVPRIEISPTGNIYLKYEDDDKIAAAIKGDLKLYTYDEALSLMYQEGYDQSGLAGYFKVDVFDGKKWCLVLLNDIFPHNEHHFTKKEYPSDTYAVCREILLALKGKPLLRTYREHYAPEMADEGE